MSKDGSIKSFFKKAQNPIQARTTQAKPDMTVSSTTSTSINSPSHNLLQQDSDRMSRNVEPSSSLTPPSSTPSEPDQPNLSFTSNATQTSAVLIDSKEICDSDEEDDLSSDSDSALEDLQDILARRKAIKDDISIPVHLSPKKKRRNVALSLSPAQTRTKYKFDMKALVKSSADSKAMEDDIRALEKSRVEEEENATRPERTQEELLASIVAEKEDMDQDKVIKAVMRIGAISTREEWRFFSFHDKPKVVAPNDAHEFPRVELDAPLSMLASTESRESAVLSGHVRDLISIGCVLPSELFFWMLDQVFLQPSEDLRDAYASIVLASPQQVKALLGRQHISTFFKRVGGTAEALDFTAKLNYTTLQDRNYIRRDWAQLCGVIELLGSMAASADTAFCAYALQLLLRLSADTIVMHRKEIFTAVDRAMIKLSRSFSDDEWTKQCGEICTTLHETIDSMPTTLQIIQCIPTTTSRLHDLRRRIALHHLLPEPVYATTPVVNLPIATILSKHLESDFYEPTNATEYISFAARISLIDIALDDGNYSPSETRSTDLNTSLPTPPLVPTVATSSPTAFNATIDLLVTQLKTIHRAIRDAGISHPGRSAAKTVLEGVYFRLEYAVRVGIKRKRGVFDAVDEELEKAEKMGKMVEAQGKFMGGFFKKKKEHVT